MAHATPAQAHDPYLVKQGVVTAPDGRSFIVELHHGDGVMAADPVRVQLRGADGAIIAWTEPADHAIAACPDWQHCAAYTFGTTSLVGRSWKLAPGRVEANALPPDLKDFSAGDRAAFLDYLANQATARVQSVALGYPGQDQDMPSRGFRPTPAEDWLGPLYIIRGQWMALLAMFAAVALHAVPRWVQQRRHIFPDWVGAGLMLAWFGLAAAVWLYVIFTLNAPLLYVAACAALGGVFGHGLGMQARPGPS